MISSLLLVENGGMSSYWMENGLIAVVASAWEVASDSGDLGPSV